MRIADYVTFANLICGLLSMYFSIEGKFATAAMLLLFAVLFDFLDGKIARLLEGSTEFGANLDSIADVISFGVAPAFLVVSFFDTMFINIFALILVCAGAFRLARFNSSKKSKGYEGLPITVNGVIFPVLVFAGAGEIVFSVLLLLSSMLMISKIKIKKL